QAGGSDAGGQPDGHAARSGQVRSFRQRDWRLLRPEAGQRGRQVRSKPLEQNREDLPQRRPVLDLRREEVPGAAGLFARLPAAQAITKQAGTACAMPAARGVTNERGKPIAMSSWLLLTVNSVTFGGLLFLLSAGFSLIFGLMRIPNLTHGSLFMLGAYIGATFVGGMLGIIFDFWLAALFAALLVAAFGAVLERFLLRQLPGQQLAQVLVTLGVSFIAADFCLMVWGGDPINVASPKGLSGFLRVGPLVVPYYRLTIIVIAVIVAIALWLLLDRTRLGAMIRAGVDDPDMARVVGIRVSRLFTIVFALGAGLAAFAGIIGGPMLSAYPGLDQDMLPLAVVVVILGGTGSRLGSFVGSIIIGFIYNFGQAMLPELAYFVLFLPMLLVLLLRPQGLFGRHVP